MPKPPKYLRGGALLLALLIATLVAAITAGLLLMLQYHRGYASQSLKHERLQRNLASATSILLTREAGGDGDTTVLDLFEEGSDSVLLIQEPWGVFDIGLAAAYEGNDTLSNGFLMGRVPQATDRYALYMADEYHPLSIAGKTRIEGDAYLPEAGIRKAYIENQAYAYEELLFGGMLHQSTPSLPPLDEAVLKRLTAYLEPDMENAATDAMQDWLSVYAADSIRPTFSGAALVLHSRDSMAVDALSITGKAVLLADSAITVSATASLENVLLFAPVIRFADGFRGRLQAFARDSIMVGRSCTFDYPSALGVVHVPEDSVVLETQPLIRMDSASVLNGLIFSYFPGSDQYLAKVTLGKETVVNGQVYADGLLELQGTVNGMTLCRRFTLLTPTSLYENFVLGGVMDLTGLSPHYAGSPLLNSGRLGKVMTWLDLQ